MKSGTTEHPKFKMLKMSLGVPDYIAVGILESLWMIAAKWKEHGGIGEWTDAMIASAIGYDGDASKLVKALVDCGWLDRHETYRLMIHDWFDHCPYYMHDRLAKREQRRKKRDSVPGQSEDSPRTVADNEGTVSGQSDPILTNPILSNPIPKTKGAEIPDALATDAFRKAWAEWQTHRAEIRKKLTPSSARKQLVMLEPLGAERAVAVIETSIRNGWQGLFPDKVETPRAEPQEAGERFKVNYEPFTAEELASMNVGEGE
jgi:hypothetical protein